MDVGPERSTLPSLIARGVLDAELAALAWLLVDGQVPLLVTGPAPASHRAGVAAALLDTRPGAAWVVLDADTAPPTLAGLSALLQGGTRLGLLLAAPDLAGAIERLRAAPISLPDDAVRRLGLVLVVEDSPAGARVAIAHYLRPTERDAHGHVQRRPPAVLAARDPASGALEHYAWGVMPELADRVDRSQADLEQRQLDRAGFLATMARHGPMPSREWTMALSRYLTTEATRTPAGRPSA